MSQPAWLTKKNWPDSPHPHIRGGRGGSLRILSLYSDSRAIYFTTFSPSLPEVAGLASKQVCSPVCSSGILQATESSSHFWDLTSAGAPPFPGLPSDPTEHIAPYKLGGFCSVLATMSSLHPLSCKLYGIKPVDSLGVSSSPCWLLGCSNTIHSLM